LGEKICVVAAGGNWLLSQTNGPRGHEQRGNYWTHSPMRYEEKAIESAKTIFGKHIIMVEKKEKETAAKKSKFYRKAWIVEGG